MQDANPWSGDLLRLNRCGKREERSASNREQKAQSAGQTKRKADAAVCVANELQLPTVAYCLMPMVI
jgi:hypothetical protein